MHSKALRFGLLLSIGFQFGGCTPAPEEPVVEASAGSESEGAGWAALEGAALGGFVEEQAFAKLSEVQAEVTPEALDGWLADAASAPELSGRGVEHLLELAAVAASRNDFERAEGIVRLVRAKARNRNSAYAGNTVLVEVARRRAGDDAEAQKAAIRSVFAELPRTRFGRATVVFQLFQVQTQLDAQLEQIQTQLVSLETASSALYFREILPTIVAHRSAYMEVIEAMQSEIDALPPLEEYAFPTVDLSGAEDAQEVNVAVWDLGVNAELFPGQVFTNEAETIDGQDNDGNGLVDDRHGVAHDIGDYTHAQLLFSPSAETIEQYTPFLQGIMDLRAGIGDSEAAQRVLTLMRSVTDVEELEALGQRLDEIGEWAHGTHVAGIMLAQVPQARMAIFRSTWAGEARIYHHRGPTDAELADERANVEAIANYIRAHNIRVVNASLGFGRDYVADALRHEQELYANDAEVQARADVVHAHREETWRQVFAACPETLFVVAAGNSNRDVMEYGEVPANVERDNVLVVGAVDSYGQWAAFTNSNPEQVRVFDFGVAVPSLIPNGSTMPLSGTSMASPNVANLATKLFSLDGNLTPARAIAIIAETGDAIAAPFSGVIANEEAAVARVRSERTQ